MAYSPKRGEFKGQQFSTKYQYRKHVLKQRFDLSPREYSKLRKSDQFKKEYEQFKKKHGKGGYNDFVKGFHKTRYISDSKTQAAFDAGEIEEQQLALKDYLVLIGYREVDDPWEVGETPKTDVA